MAAVQCYGPTLQHVSAALRADNAVVTAAVRQNGQALEYASAELRADKAVVTAAVRHLLCALRHASAELRENPDLFALSKDFVHIKVRSQDGT